MIYQAILFGIMMLVATETHSAPVPMATCPTSCGNLPIPFPFGTTSDCSLDDSFLITCDHDYNPPKPFLNQGSIEVLDISLDGLMRVASSVASNRHDKSGSQIKGTISELTSSKYRISSTRNKFANIDCETYALAGGTREWQQMTAGYVSWSGSIASMVNGTCSGVSCYPASIPKGVRDFLVDTRSLNPCGYGLGAETEAFKFSSSDLKDLHSGKSVPVLLAWSVGNLSCPEARENLSSLACRATQSECSNSTNGLGYNCRCLTGFQGNPYLSDGCQDIDECKTAEPCEGTCTNLLGSYSCSCPEGFEGDGRKDGAGCHPKSLTNVSTVFYIVSGLVVPAVGSSWIIWRRKQKKVAKLRRNLFIRNGGELLLGKLPTQSTFSIFTAEDLKNATDNYDESKVVCREEHTGITYKGMLPGVNRMVTIKYYHAFDRCNVEVLISKLVTLSQIGHKNVAKLLGCCLETQVPLLVYEFITDTTLYDHINDDCLARALSWTIRLRIAAQTAGALAYMHSCAAVPIIHGSLSSASIFLHEGHTVKVHGFALTCSECSCFRFSVGASDYLDPGYSFSGRLTEKSDVYSFGFVLVELLTGKNVMSPGWLEEGEHLAHYFVSSSGGGSLLEILDHRLATDGYLGQLTEVSELARRCLSSSCPERPTMKEVAIAMECVISRIP